MIAIHKIVSLSFLFLGVFILIQVVMPIVSFEIWELGQKFDNETTLVSPQKGQLVLGVSIESKDNFPAFVSSLKREIAPSYTQFRINVPKLKLSEITVLVDSNDLTRGLVHLPGSALPGERGNVFISGHSAVTPLISLKTAFFSKLSDLKKGDEIIVEAEGTKFTYQVIDLRAVDPKDTSVISPPDKMGRFITLMTCVPPGLNFKRLVVLGKII